MRGKLEHYFEFEAVGTNWRTEVPAGFTAFVAMACIIFVNPSIQGEAGMPVAATLAATCVPAAFGSILMGVFARYPIALAPGMGLNAHFAYSVVKRMGVAWQTALGAVFLSGVIFLLLALGGIRKLILRIDRARSVCRGGGRDRTVHRVHWIPQRRHRGAGSGDDGDT